MAQNKIKLSVVLLILIIVGGSIAFWQFNRDTPRPTPAPKAETTKQSVETTESSFDKKQYSIDDPASIWTVANKQRPLPASYAPTDLIDSNGVLLRSAAAEANKQLMAAASKDGVMISTISGYRSYATQKDLYASYVARDGQAAADTYSARAGYSEHQTGLAADLGNGGSCDLEICFGSIDAGKWIAAHAHEYGFIVRYTQAKVSITGYQAEPWHIRYVGIALATELHQKNQTMEEFFGLPAAPGY